MKVFATVLCSWLAMAAALAAGATNALTWADCIRTASLNNPDLAAAMESVVQARAEYAAARAGYLPRISVSAGHNGSGSFSSDTNEYTQSGVEESSSVDISLTQPLYAGGRITAEKDSAKAALDSAEESLRQAKAAVGFDLKAAFARLLYAQELVTLTGQIVDRRKKNLDLVELRFEGGREHKGSLLRSKASYRESQFEAAQAGRAVDVACRKLASVLGVKGSVPSVRGELTAFKPGSVPDFNTLARTTPAYMQSIARLKIAQEGITAARSRYLPEISLSGSASESGEDWALDDDGWRVGVSLSYPLFSGGSDKLGVESAEANYREAQENLRSDENQVAADLQEGFASLLDSLENVAVREEFLTAAEIRSDISGNQYTSGLMSFEDWDIIENDLISNQKSLLGAQRDAVLAEAAWELRQGKGSIP